MDVHILAMPGIDVEGRLARTLLNTVLLGAAFLLLLLDTLNTVVEVVLCGGTLGGVLALYTHKKLASCPTCQTWISPRKKLSRCSKLGECARTFLECLLRVDNLLLILFLLLFLFLFLFGLLRLLGSVVLRLRLGALLLLQARQHKRHHV